MVIRRCAIGSCVRSATRSEILDKLAAARRVRSTFRSDEDKLKFASGFLSNDDANQSAAKNIVGGLKRINVRVFEFDNQNSSPASRPDMFPSNSGPAGAKWSRPRIGTRWPKSTCSAKEKNLEADNYRVRKERTCRRQYRGTDRPENAWLARRESSVYRKIGQHDT